MVEVGFDTSNLAILTKKDSNGSIVCETCCAFEIGNDCGYCNAGETPKYITVSASGMSDCGCVAGTVARNCVPGGDKTHIAYKTFGDISGQLNGIQHILEQHPSSYCTWTKSGISLMNCGFHFYEEHIDAGPIDCENLPPEPHATITFTSCVYSVVRWANHITFYIQGITASCVLPIPLIQWDIDCSGDSTCVDCTGTVTESSSCDIDDTPMEPDCECSVEYILESGTPSVRSGQ